VHESPRAVPTPVPVLPPCSVSCRDATESLDAPPRCSPYIRTYGPNGQMMAPWLVWLRVWCHANGVGEMWRHTLASEGMPASGATLSSENNAIQTLWRRHDLCKRLCTKEETPCSTRRAKQSARGQRRSSTLFRRSSSLGG